MAKNRKLTFSRSELLLGSYSFGPSNGTIAGESELREDDVWSTVDDVGGFNGNSSSYSNGGAWGSHAALEPERSLRARGGCPRGMEEDGNHLGGGMSLAFNDRGRTSPRIVHQIRGQEMVGSPLGRHMATSAPVNVPDWSKIYRVDSVESMHDSDDNDDGNYDMVPPHEYLARSRNSTAHSVYEGVGRTLKGRDLSRVRDAVWSQTGFDG